jgi:hypothetical protein
MSIEGELTASAKIAADEGIAEETTSMLEETKRGSSVNWGEM